MAKIVKKKTKKTRKTRKVTSRKPGLNVNDAMRLASADEKFAKELVLNPDAFKRVFNMKASEIKAIKDSFPGRGGVAATEYE